MTDKRAYRASVEFAAALRAVEGEIARFRRDVVATWDAEHPETPSLWVQRAVSVDRDCVGFKDSGGEVPAGLSRAKTRIELLPARGKAGDPWREAMGTLNNGPKASPIFRQFAIDPGILRVDHGRYYTPGILVTPDEVFLTWGVPREELSEHLTEVPLSEYYAALERSELERSS